MAKTKNKKKNLSENVHKKKETLLKKTLNPFEMHINKQKMIVLGRKAKNDRGLPGVSRGKALKKRKETLLQEYKQVNKSNKFTDRRIGEKNYGLTEEDRVMARFTAVRMRQHKKSIFNLADDEVLTHKGQTLSEIEKFDDPRSDDEDNFDETDKFGKLDSHFVEDAHFGGGILTKTGKEGFKTHKELIEQLISESKKRKAEKQKSKEATLELTEKLDTEWKDLLPLVSKSKKSKDDELPKQKVDDYDKVMRELVFEARGTVSDRLKTEDEVAKEEKERLEKLENERLERMQGFNETNSKKQSYRSADDLDDDFVYEADPDYMLSYNKEGASNLEVNAELNGKTITHENADSAGEESELEAEEEEEEEEEAETESEDDLSDLKAEESSGESENETEEKQSQSSEAEEKQAQSTETDEKIKNNLLKRKEIMEKAREELPYTFDLPKTYEDLQKLFENRSSNHQSVIIERMIKCNHPSLGKDNKEALGVLFAFLLQHLNDLALDSTTEASIISCFDIFTALAPRIFELAQLNEMNAHMSVKEVIKEKHEEYRKKPKNFPGLEMLVFLKLVSLLFSTSDFRHQIVSPCFVFMEQILNKCKIKSRKDIAFGIFVATLVLEYTSLSKRVLPAVINYLGGILHMAIPKVGVKLIKVNPPFKPTSTNLVLIEDYSKKELTCKMEPIDLITEEINEEFKIRAISTTLNLIEDFNNLLVDLPSAPELFSCIEDYLQLLQRPEYPKSVQEKVISLSTLLKTRKNNRNLEFIVMEAARPKALRLYEPKIEEVFDGKRRKIQSREKAEHDKLVYKLKKETKGALREIRRDREFLGRVKIRQKIKSDQERREKVKRIFSEAAVQQSELNTLDRKNKKK